MTLQAVIPPYVRPERSTVAVVFTAPGTVIDDVAQVMTLAGLRDAMPRDVPTGLHVNISWERWYPACSTTPWQYEGVIRALRQAGFGELIPAYNSTVVVDAHEGERQNHLDVVQNRHGLRPVYLDDRGMSWSRYEPRGALAVLDRVFPDGVYIPDSIVGQNMVQLPTMKTHVFTTMTGAMKCAFGNLLGLNRHWAHAEIHAVLADLLLIQREIHPGIFAVMDGTFAGDGPGPRAMRPHVKNVLLASADPVALDAVAARMMGFDPLSIPFIRMADERALGHGESSRIDVVGADVSDVNFGFARDEDTLASRGQKAIYWGPLKPLERTLLRSRIAPMSFLASDLYHNRFWYPLFGRSRARWARRTAWGRLFDEYGDA